MTESIKGVTPEQLSYLEKARRAKVSHITPFLAYLLSGRAEGISGQVFGARGREIFLFSQPRPVQTRESPGGWNEDSLHDALNELRPGFIPLETDLELFQSDPVV